jgi:hypothetical protein
MSTVSTTKVSGEKFPLFLSVFGIVVISLPIALWLLGRFSLRTYFLFSFIWLLISSEVFAPTDPDSGWWDLVTVVKLAGWAIFVYIITNQILTVVAFLPPVRTGVTIDR